MHPLLIIMVSAQGHGVHFWCGGTHRTESVTPSDKVIMRLLVSIGDSQLNYPRWGGGILHGPIVLSLVKVNFWMWVGAEESAGKCHQVSDDEPSECCVEDDMLELVECRRVQYMLRASCLFLVCVTR